MREEINNKFKHKFSMSLSYTQTLTSMNSSIASLTEMLTQAFKIYNPDINIAVADRWEQLAFANTSACHNIPLVHIQGGEVSGNIDDKIRNVISMLSEVHFPSHRFAAERLKSFDREHIYDYGCPSIDLIKKNDIRRDRELSDYFICMFHPHTKEIEKITSQLEQLSESVGKFIAKYNLKCYWFRNNDDPGARLIGLGGIEKKNIEFVTNISGIEYLKLLANARLIVGNSSSGIREAGYLGVPSIITGDRQKNRITGNNVLRAKFNIPDDIYKKMTSIHSSRILGSDLFGIGNTSKKIVKKIKEIYS